jgi:uncharacterized protein YlxW (UPF0749 family)
MSDSTDSTGATARSTDDASTRMRTPLLALITAEALERDYQMVAKRRIQSGDQPQGRARTTGRVGVVAVVAAFGALVTLAAVQTSRNADVDSAGRASLIGRIEDAGQRVRDLQGELADGREANAAAEGALLELGNRVNNVEGNADELGAVTGFTAVVGEGIRIELENAPYAADPDTEFIRDSDLTLLVNALWTAGAEAIAINGQRITLRTAIRNSGTPIEVNSTGIAPPYVIQAIGNMDTLAANLAETSSGASFAVLADDYGWSYEVDNVEDQRLPAAPGRLRQLRSAEQATGSGRQPEGDE